MTKTFDADAKYIIERLGAEFSAYIADFWRKCFSDGWNVKMTESAFLTGNYRVVCIKETNEKDGCICGIAAYTLGLDGADIESVAVLPEKRAKGYGSALVAFVTDEIKNFGLNKIMLEVRKSNAAAVKLYLRHGFKQISVRKRYYADGEDALIMIKELSL